MESILIPLKKDLESLYNQDTIETAIQLNANLGGKYFSENGQPMFFVGDFSAKTVFVMLNPGSKANDCYSFIKMEKPNYYSLEYYIDRYLFQHRNYGAMDSCRMDNFDLKQAAFLYDFKDTGIDFPDFFNEPNEVRHLKLQAKENVLMKKLQLELIPYQSKNFTGILDSEQQAETNIKVLSPYVSRLLDAIVEYDRKYIVFGAKQFYNLFSAFKKSVYADINFFDEKSVEIDGLKKRVYCRIMEIKHKQKTIRAIIPYSFPRQDLPNAYSKMRQFGKFCFDVFQNT
jgi:hypothetical protein